MPYLLTALVTHLVNVVPLYALARMRFESVVVAMAVALVWGTTPIVAGSLEWYAANGHVLATTFLLVALLMLARHVARGVPIGLGTVVGLTVALILGATCFGTGIAVALVFPLPAWLLVPPSLWGRRARPALRLHPGVDRSLSVTDSQVDAAPFGATALLMNEDPSPGRIRGINTFAHLPGRAGFVFARYGSDQVRGRRVRFIEADPAKRDAVHKLYAGPMRDLLVSVEGGVALRRQAQVETR